MIHFVSPFFSSRKANYLMNKGEIVSLSRGIYADTDDTIEDIHAQGLKLIAYRYPNARLMGESALRVMKGLTPILPNGKVYLEVSGAGQRRERELIPGVNVIIREQERNKFSPLSRKVNIELEPGVKQTIFMPSIAQTIMDAVNYPETAMSNTDFLSMFDDLPENIAMELNLNQDVIKKQQEAMNEVSADISNDSKMELKVFIADKLAANLRFDGVSWVSDGESELPPIFESGSIGERHNLMTNYLKSVIPQGWTLSHDGGRNIFEEYIKNPRRLMNATVLHQEDYTRVVINKGNDLGILSNFVNKDFVFEGFPDKDFTQIYKVGNTYKKDIQSTRIAGTFAKMPAYLDGGGNLQFSDSTTPMTHIVKLDEMNQHKGTHGLAALEWAGQLVARHAGLETPNVALVPSQDKSTAYMITERFDIPFNEEDSIYQVGIDGSAVLGLDENEIFDPSAIQIFKAFMKEGLPRSEAPKFFDRFAYAWLSGDTDLHAKNVSIKKTLNKDGTAWETKMAPAYDTVSTLAFKGNFLNHDDSALHIGRKRNDLKDKDWVEFGRILGVPNPKERIERMAHRVAEGYCALANNESFWHNNFNEDYANRSIELMKNAAEVARERAASLGISQENIQMIEMKDVLDSYSGMRDELMSEKKLESWFV